MLRKKLIGSQEVKSASVIIYALSGNYKKIGSTNPYTQFLAAIFIAFLICSDQNMAAFDGIVCRSHVLPTYRIPYQKLF